MATLKWQSKVVKSWNFYLRIVFGFLERHADKILKTFLQVFASEVEVWWFWLNWLGIYFCNFDACFDNDWAFWGWWVDQKVGVGSLVDGLQRRGWLIRCGRRRTTQIFDTGLHKCFRIARTFQLVFNRWKVPVEKIYVCFWRLQANVCKFNHYSCNS